MVKEILFHEGLHIVFTINNRERQKFTIWKIPSFSCVIPYWFESYMRLTLLKVRGKEDVTWGNLHLNQSETFLKVKKLR